MEIAHVEIPISNSLFQNTPDLSAVVQAITTIQSDLKTTAETVQSTAIKVQQHTITQQHMATLSQETN